MMDNPALDRMLDQPDQPQVIIWNRVPCEILRWYDWSGIRWVEIKALDGTPFVRYVRGKEEHYDTKSIMAQSAERLLP